MKHPVNIKTGRNLLRIGLVLCIAAGLSCSRKDSPDQKSKSAATKSVLVSAGSVEKKSFPVELKTFGNVEACSTAFVKSEVGGKITTIHFRKGQKIHKGDLLFTIDPRPFQAALDQAQANLDRAEVGRTEARKNEARDAELLKKGILAQSDYDRSQALADALDAEVRADRAAVETARLQLEHCLIRSPIDGLAGNLLINEGNLIKASENNLVTIKQIQPIEVFFSIPQKVFPKVKTYMAAGGLSVQALPPEENTPEIGNLFFVDNAVDKTTGTILIGAVFQNEKERLWPGQYVNITLTLEVRPDAVVVPAKAVQTGRDGKYVFVIKADQTVVIRPIVTGSTAGNEVVVDQGLQPGELVVTDGQFRLTDGAKVEIKKGDSANINPPKTDPIAETSQKGSGR
jgi:membrane fusion protein, multidrug efflux system